MGCKAKVLRRFPEAKLIVRTRWFDDTPRHYSVFVGPLQLDIHDDHDTQGATAAWRSALAWCHRNPERKAA